MKHPPSKPLYPIKFGYPRNLQNPQSRYYDLGDTLLFLPCLEILRYDLISLDS